MANDQLQTMKYSELQKLAKKIGIKANMKADKLIKAIKEAQDSQGSKVSAKDEQPTRQETPKAVQEEKPAPSTDEEKTPPARKPNGRGRKRKTNKNSGGDESVSEKKAGSETEEKTTDNEQTTTTHTQKKSLEQNNGRRSRSSKGVVKVVSLEDKKRENKSKTPVCSITPKTTLNKSAKTNKVAAKSTPLVNRGKTKTPQSNKPTPVSSRNTPKVIVNKKKTPLPAVGTKSKSLKPTTFKSGTPAKRTKAVIEKKVTGKRSISRSRTPKATEQVNMPAVSMKEEKANKVAGEKRKRSTTPKLNSTYELEKENSFHEEEPKAKKTKRNTFDVIKDEPRKTRQSASPSVRGMLDSLKPEMSHEQMKNSLMEALNKNVQEKKTKDPADHTSIPRFAAFLAKKKEAAQSAKKPITPGNKNWAKIHQRQFDKLDSIDSYLDKKRKRIETLATSVKKAKLTAQEMRSSVQQLKKTGAKVAKPVIRKSQSGTAFVPTVTSTTNMNLNFASTTKPRVSAGKVARKSQSSAEAFVPTVTSTVNMNLNFASVTKPRSSIGKVLKTPAASGPVKTVKPLTASKENLEKRKSNGAHLAKKTPYKMGDTSIAPSPKKPVFDLKASLAKPLTWKAYTGKLKPVEPSKPAVPVAKTPGKDTMKQHQALAKKRPGPVTKDDRRKAAEAQRANRKGDNMMKRRGIMA